MIADLATLLGCPETKIMGQIWGRFPGTWGDVGQPHATSRT